MKPLAQPIGGSRIEVLEVPHPVPGPTEGLVRTVASVICPGAKRAVIGRAHVLLKIEVARFMLVTPRQHILLLTHHLRAKAGAPHARPSSLAAVWAAGGDQVTVLSGMPNHPTGLLPNIRRVGLRRMRRHSYRVARSWLCVMHNERARWRRTPGETRRPM